MGRTQIDTEQIREVQRNDLDVSTTGQAVVAKVLSSEGVAHSSTGGDSGTGDVTVKLDVNGLTADASPDSSADFVPSFDNSAGTHKKVLMKNIKNGKYTVGITVDGAGSVVTNGEKGFKQVNFSGTLTGVTLLADASGNVRFNITKGAYADYPGSMVSIVGANNAELSSAQKASITLDGGWTTSISAGDILVFSIVATPTTITRVTLMLHYEE